MGRIFAPVWLDPPPAAPPPPAPLLGVGLGRAGGPAALAIVRRQAAAAGATARYTVRHLERWPAGSAYSAMAEQTGAAVESLARPGCRLLVDAGQGGAVLDAFRRAKGLAWLVPVLVTAAPGPGLTPDDRSDWARVAASELASAVLVLLQQGRLEVDDLPGRDALLAALRAFGARAGEIGRLAGAPFGAGVDEEMIAAVALPCWYGEWRGDPTPSPRPVPAAPRDPRRNLTPRHDSAARRRGLFGAGPGPGGDGYRII
jgi:hypothetical protein